MKSRVKGQLAKKYLHTTSVEFQPRENYITVLFQFNNIMLEDVVEKEEPLAPLSWVKFCPGQSDDLNKVLEDCGWYYEDLGWEESEKLLQDRPVGHWLLKDCKFDDRYFYYFLL